MVQLTLSIFRNYNRKFSDKLRIYVRGGTGGNGIPSLGGFGGKGGDVYVVAAKDSNKTLNDMKKQFPSQRFVADVGQTSSRKHLFGLKGASIFVPVPLGVTIVDTDAKRIIGEIMKPNDKLLVASGGSGASAHNRYIPAKGKRRNLFLDLKAIADVGFVGFPNAGKSTLLAALSNATPKIANYPFTTLNPEIGVMEYDDFRKIQLADLPGLIEGAFMNKGRGHNFLKHIERNHMILFVVDINGFQLSMESKFRTAFETILLLTKELELYDDSVLKKDMILAINKMDSENSNELFEEFQNQMNNYGSNLHTIPDSLIPEEKPNFKEIIPISAIEKSGTEEVKSRIREIIDELTPSMDENLKLEEGEDAKIPTLESNSNERKLIL